MISRDDDWIQIAELDSVDRIVFTPAFREIMGDLGWEAKAFVGHLLRLPRRLLLAYRERAEHMGERLAGTPGPRQAS